MPKRLFLLGSRFDERHFARVELLKLVTTTKLYEESKIAQLVSVGMDITLFVSGENSNWRSCTLRIIVLHIALLDVAPFQLRCCDRKQCSTH